MQHGLKDNKMYLVTYTNTDNNIILGKSQ